MRIAILLLVSTCWAQQWSGVLDPSRAVDWSATHPGVTGGAIGALPDALWPNCTTASCSTLFGGTVTAASIVAALGSAPANSVVRIPAGTFTPTGWLMQGINNVVLRGAGANQTFLVLSDNVGGCRGITGFVGICISTSSSNDKATQQNGPVNLTGTFSKGQTTLTFASVPNLKVGNIVVFDQTNDTADDGSILVTDTNSTITASSPACSGNGNTAPCGTVGPVSLEANNGGTQRTGRQEMQVVTITACGGVTTLGSSCSGTNVSVTFDPGLAMPNWASGKTPQAWWASSPVSNVGIENMSIDFTSAGSVPGIAIANAHDTWISGVRSIQTNRSHVQIDYSQHITVRDSYFFLTLNSLSQSYGAECNGASDVLVENNIFQAVTAPLMSNGPCSGTVFGYNFQINNYYVGSTHYNIVGLIDHTAGIDNYLWEGNYGNATGHDVFHGSHHFGTIFRNRFTGPQPACWVSGSPYSSATFGTCTNSLNVVQMLSYTRFYNYIGNILGTTGTNTNYSSGGSNTLVWDIGQGNTEGAVTVPADPNVLPTLMRWGNCDSASGFGSCRFVSGEVPSALSGSQAAYSNPVPANNTLPASFYYTSKPSWWPGTKAWPAIGPDVSGGNVSGVNGLAFTIPAQDCFLTTMGGPSDGTGAVLSFNASTCYSAAAAPTGSVTGGKLIIGGKAIIK